MATWIDYIIVGTVIVLGLGLFYKVLKEPIDLVVGLIASGFRRVIEMVSGTAERGGEIIEYG